MLFIIHCLDKPDYLEKRLSVIDDHRAYLSGDLPVEIVMSGPLTTDDGATMIGSLFLVEADSRADVQAFQKADPLYKADVWQSIDINAFYRRQG